MKLLLRTALLLTGGVLCFVNLFAQPPDSALFRAVQTGNLSEAVGLLDAGAVVNAVDAQGYSPLSYACAQENLQFIPMLLGYGADFRGKDLTEAPLITAVRCGSYKHVMLLLRAGAPADQVDSTGLNLMFLAAGRNQVAMLQELHAQQVPAFLREKGPWQYAHSYAAFRGAADALVVLLDQTGISPDAPDQGRTALGWAALGGDPTACQMLLDRGADPNLPDAQGSYPLHHACAGGHAAVALALLEAGATPNAADGSGNFPVHYAVENGMYAIIQVLRSRGANLNAPNRVGKSALAVAAERGDALLCRGLLQMGAAPGQAGVPETVTAILRRDSAAFVRVFRPKVAVNSRYLGRRMLSWAILSGEAEFARKLIARGADLAARDADGQTALHHAAAMDQGALIGLLLDQGHPVDPFDYAHFTPLHRAVKARRTTAIKWLLDRGAGLDLPTNDGDGNRLPLHLAIAGGVRIIDAVAARGAALDVPDGYGNQIAHLAVLSGDTASLRYVLDAGARVNPVNQDGDSPLHLAARQGKEGMGRMLLEAGAQVDRRNAKGETPAEVAFGSFHLRLGTILR